MELAFERIEGADARADVLFLHGILGRGANLRTLAKRFVAACPGWSAVLLDLRGHGGSALHERPGGGAGEPATITQCARDVRHATAWNRLPPLAVFGHSFGGKVALEIAQTPWEHLADGEAGEAHALVRCPRHYVIVDSLPGPRTTGRGSETTLEVLDTLSALPGPFPTRQAFVEALRERDIASGIAEWLATSLRKNDDGTFRFGIDLAMVRALLDDYFANDLWSAVEAPANPEAKVHLVIGDRSEVFDPAARERARALEAARPGRVTVDVLAAGHWVHVDAPDALLEVMVRRLGPAPSLEGVAAGGEA